MTELYPSTIEYRAHIEAMTNWQRKMWQREGRTRNKEKLLWFVAIRRRGFPVYDTEATAQARVDAQKARLIAAETASTQQEDYSTHTFHRGWITYWLDAYKAMRLRVAQRRAGQRSTRKHQQRKGKTSKWTRRR